ncbi:hypothetical protein Cycma_0467 [Cyclobacterium marinum DSM 745]|uniref:Uncharacterized protein n=1 Tax=Cyclobacterium marinum (strain ATCC 25205 / DSM 745 / LMG 13164 / NCIMB 1802) TaxID=880070 RepID=G0IWQ3_CYCMS|nr:hypothetical protein Cycma_0467 [Cyclobacterium marinum DSM 745]
MLLYKNFVIQLITIKTTRIIKNIIILPTIESVKSAE